MQDMEDVETVEAHDDTACDKKIPDTPERQKGLPRDDLVRTR